MNVYAWPPVAPSAWEWSAVDPLETSRSLLTGRRYAASAQRRRRVARMTVNAVVGDAGGYMEALKRLLKGGANLVRLRNYPMVWGAIPPAELRGAELLRWTTGAETLAWQTGAEALAWFTGRVLSGAISTVDGLPALTVTGLPPSTLVGRVGEPVTVWPQVTTLDYSAAQSRVLLRRLTSDTSGTATAVLDSAVTISGRVDIGFETAAFEAVGLPRVQRQIGQAWSYDWDFAEVFADEVGSFTEVNPW